MLCGVPQMLGGEPLEVRLVGGIAASVGGEDLDLGGPKQRMTFAVLVLGTRKSVALDRIVDIVWGEQPPNAPRCRCAAMSPTSAGC